MISHDKTFVKKYINF